MFSPSVCLGEIWLGLGIRVATFFKTCSFGYTFVLFVLCLFVILVVSHFGFDGKTVFLIYQFLVIAYLLLFYHVGNHIVLSEHPCVN